MQFSLGHTRHLARTDEHHRMLKDFAEDKDGIRSRCSRHEYARRIQQGQRRDFMVGNESAEQGAEDGEEDTTAGDGAFQVSPLWQGLGTHYCKFFRCMFEFLIRRFSFIINSMVVIVAFILNVDWWF